MADSQNPPTRNKVPRTIGCLALLLTYVGLPAVAFSSLKIADKMLQPLFIGSLYGSQAYVDGLRVIGRQGQLSDGRRLPQGWNLALGFCTFVLSIPGWLGYCAILAVFGVFPPDRVFKKK